MEDWAVAQILPGPNVVNLSLMLGDRYFGLRGAFGGVGGDVDISALVHFGHRRWFLPVWRTSRWRKARSKAWARWRRV